MHLQEDVLELVSLSETIRRERQERIREIQRERDRLEHRARERDEWERRERRRERDSGFSDERIIEREIIYDNRNEIICFSLLDCNSIEVCHFPHTWVSMNIIIL